MKEGKAEAKTDDLSRHYGASRNTFCRWRAKYGRMEVSGARRPRNLESKNRQLKQLVTDLAIEKTTLGLMLSARF